MKLTTQWANAAVTKCRRLRWPLCGLYIGILAILMGLWQISITLIHCRFESRAKDTITTLGGIAYTQSTAFSDFCGRFGIELNQDIETIYFHSPTWTPSGSSEYLYMATSVLDDDKMLELLGHIDSLRPFPKLHLIGMNVTDKGMRALCELGDLEELDLSGSKVTDLGFTSIEHLRKLRSLTLRDTQISDATFKRIISLPSIQDVDVRGTHVTNDCVLSVQSNSKVRIQF